MKPIASRASLALVSLATYLMRVEIGDVLPARQELARRARTGVGTLERALDTLIASGAVRVDGIQGTGTTVTGIDYSALWRASGGSILRGQLPLHMSVEMEAIETALKTAFAARDIEVALVVQEGASRRLLAIGRGLSDFAVTSRTALRRAGDRMAAAHTFGPGSYYGDATWYRLQRAAGGDIMRVGADSESPDHVEMVQHEFPGAEIVNTPFRLIPPQITQGILDATVWCGGMALPAEYLATLRAVPVTTSGVEVAAADAVVAAASGGGVLHLLAELDHEILDKTFAQVLETEKTGGGR